MASGVVALALLAGCDQAEPTPAPEPTPGEMLARVDQLAARLRAGTISDDEFDDALRPWQPAVLKRWPESDLERGSLSLFQLRTSLMDRYRIGESYCSDDREVLWDTCGAGYLCANYAVLSELRCLWSTQIPR